MSRSSESRSWRSWMRANSSPAMGTRSTRRLTTRRRTPMRPTRRRKRPRIALLPGRLVADTVHRRDRVPARAAKLRADAANMGVDRALGDQVVVAVGPLHQLGAGEDDARALEEGAEEAELGRGEIDRR